MQYQPSAFDTTLPATLARGVRQAPDKTLLDTDAGRLSYAQFQARVDRVATALLGMGVAHGDRVGIAGVNSPAWLITYMAAARIGAILVTLNVIYREHEFVYMLGDSGARVMVCDHRAGGFAFEPFLNDLRPRIPSVEHVVFMGAEAGATTATRWEELERTPVDAARLEAAAARVRPADPAIILYTSGTTGDPKGATLTHRSLLASAVAQAERFEQGPDDTMLCVLPLNHVGGVTCGFGSTLVSGGTMVMPPRFHPDAVASAMRRTPISVFLGVPTMYRMLLEADSMQSVDTSAMRQLSIGGSNVEPALAEAITARFPNARLANLYGLSEVSGACTISPSSDTIADVGRSIGTMLGDFEARIVDEEGRPLPTGETGELQVRGACVSAGYWNKPEQTRAAFLPDGWLATGDAAALSADGHVSIRGRYKEMYIHGGYNVYPAEIENLVAKHPTVSTCAVIGMPDARFGESGCAFVIPRPGATIDVDALAALCREQLADYKVPRRFVVVDTLPMTPAGKIRKVALRAPVDPD